MTGSPQRLGIYVDAPFRLVPVDGTTRVAAHPADYALVGVFLAEVGTHFASLVLFGRATTADRLDEYVALPEEIGFVELPHYDGLVHLGSVARATGGTLARFWRGLDDVDVVWAFGPHPFAVALVLLAAVRRRRSVLGVRQDTISYFRHRLPSRWWTPALLPILLLDTTFRLLARRVRTLVAGGDIARRYGGRDRVFVMADAVVSERDLAAGPRTPRSSKRIELLTVARIDPEKNPLLLVDVLAHLERVAPGRYRLTWVGGGPLEERVRQYAAERGVAALVDLRGWLPFGDRLLDLYRRADIFVHVSRTEGAPRVVFEALACATPVVATDVGGVRAMVDDGRAALLVPVDDAPALASAVRRLDSEDELRRRLVVHGLALARERTLERQAARVASFIAADEVCAA